jgi:hypothetical protein
MNLAFFRLFLNFYFIVLLIIATPPRVKLFNEIRLFQIQLLHLNRL